MPLFVGSRQALRKLARDTNDLGLLNQDYAYLMFQGCAPIWMYPYNWTAIAPDYPDVIIAPQGDPVCCN